MLQSQQTVYYTSGPFVQEATFLSYEGNNCLLQTPMGTLKIRKGRVFTAQEATEHGLLDPETAKRVREAFAV